MPLGSVNHNILQLIHFAHVENNKKSWQRKKSSRVSRDIDLTPKDKFDICQQAMHQQQVVLFCTGLPPLFHTTTFQGQYPLSTGTL